MTQKWRPTLLMVLGGALAGTLGISFIGALILRAYRFEFGLMTTAVPIALVVLVLTMAIGLVLVRLLLRPVRALAHYAGEVKLARANPRAPPAQYGTVELYDMATSVIEMAEALRAREATMRSYSDHVTHELKSPVSAVVAAAELLQDRELAPQDKALVDQIAGAAAQMHQQLDALRDMARARSADYRGHTRLQPLTAALKQRHPKLTLTFEDDGVHVPLSRDGLDLILDHLLHNAAQHGAKTVRLEAAEGRLRLTDDGEGIAQSNLDRVFDPFFTTRRETGGTGMGLAIISNILTAHGGRIRALANPTGAMFEIGFRNSDADAAA